MPSVETIAAPATPSGESAIAVVRVSGPLALPIATSLRSGRPPLPWRAWFGDYRTVSAERLDEVVCTYFASPKSYTGEDVLEISSHGNPFITSKIMDDLRARGCRTAMPGEFSQRAFLNGRMDLTRAEAVMDVIRARSDRALDFSLRQLRGEMAERMNGVVDKLLHICASVEAYIDFPEEDLPQEDRESRLSEIDTLCGELRRIRSSRHCRTILMEGPRVALIGLPNVGKSTLFNRLAGSDRAIVSEQPGTTRDFIETASLAGHHRIRLVDTAGIRESSDVVEQSGVDRAVAQGIDAEIVILVVDGRLAPPTLPRSLSDRLESRPSIVAVNMADLVRPDMERFAGLGSRPIALSALTGMGVDVVRAEIEHHTDRLSRSGDHDEGVCVNERHAEALGMAADCLIEASDGLRRKDSLELCASALRSAVDAVGRIVGRIDNEAMLDRLFRNFCIGK